MANLTLFKAEHVNLLSLQEIYECKHTVAQIGITANKYPLETKGVIQCLPQDNIK